MATRQLKFDGQVMSTPAAATIIVNGVEVYSGQVGVGKPLNELVDLQVVEFEGTGGQEVVSISVSVTSGVARFGTIMADQTPGTEYAPWVYPGPERYSPEGQVTEGWDDGRQNILINGLPPEWPPLPIGPQPGGTPEDPNWSGWCFELSAGETLTCDYLVLAQTPLPQ